MGRGGNAGGPDASPSKPRDPKMQPAKVKMLDGTHKEFELHRGSHGDCLFQTVCSDLSIEEKDYFSLCFYDKEGVRHWLYNDKKILRQLKGLPWEFSYEVKFYPLNPSTLNDDHARYNMFLQLKNDVLKERLPATLPTQAILGSLVAQAEFGDAVASAEYEQFLQRARLAPNMNEQLMSQIRDLHKENKGQTSAEAECNYLDQCKQLSKYGVFLYPAKDDHNQAVDVGICATGINIYQGAIRIHRFHWQSINKISFRRNTFSVKLNAGEMGKKEVTLTYKVHDYAQAKRVWKCGVEHHTFFRLIQPDDKQKSGLLRFGSTKFRYQGRTQFQSKMASQMFDNSATNTVQRQSRLTQSCENVINATSPQPTTELAYTSNELELKPLPRSEQSYEISSAQKRSSTEKVGGDIDAMDDDDDLTYTPAESPYSAAYYISGRSSSMRSPYSSGPVSPHDAQLQQQQRSEQHQPPILRAQGARRNLFGRTSTASETVRLVSFHEPLDYSNFLPATRISDELSHIPINESVQLYHKGHYSRLPNTSNAAGHRNEPAPLEGYPEMRRVHQINGHGHYDELTPADDAPEHPIRFFVNVHHSGQSKAKRFIREVHAGKEDIVEQKEPYSLPTYHNIPTYRLEKINDLPISNIRQFSNVYYNTGATSSLASTSRFEPEEQRVRLITRIRKDSYSQTDTSASPSKKQQEKTMEQPIKTTAEEHRFLYIARVRHEGDEDVVDQADVKPESYGVASTSYDGPLEETAREDDLEHAPINDHASVYHPGQSWLRTAKSPTKSETVTTEEVHGEKKKKKAILHLKSPQKVDEVPEEPDERKVRLIARVPHDENEEPVHEKTKPTREVHGTGRFGFWKSSGRKSKTISESSDYPTTDKYEGPLDAVDRQNDLDTLPLDSNVSQVAYSPKTHVIVVKERTVKETTSTTEPGEEHRFLYIARIRHEGDEDVVDQADVKPESYGVASTSYDGPLEETAREDDLEHAPINDHASVYHPGQSWLKTAKSPTNSETVTTEEVHGEKKKKKKAILHLKSPQKVDEVPEEPEERKVRLIAHVPHDENEEPVHEKIKPTREVHGTGRFGFWKSSGRKSKTISESSDYPTTDKYEGPLDAVDRQNDLDTLPLDSNVSQVAYSPKTHVEVVKETTIKETTSTTEPEEEHRFLYIARVRHEGDEDVVDQADVKPESYGVASTSYDGPLEETAREDDLEHAPINDHASVYHPGQSWLKTAKSPTKSETVTTEEVHGEKKKKKAILHLKSPQKVDEVPEEPEERKVRLIARVPHDENEEPVHEKTKPTREAHGSGRFGFWKSSGRKSKTISESSDYPTTDKYEGPLDAVDRQNDLDTLPLDSNVSQVAYSPKTHVIVVKERTVKETTSTTEPGEEHRFLYIARIRHEGDEDVVDQADVKPESYGVASTSYDGPLEETAREDDLEHAPINDHASVYHPGQSWLKTAKSPTKSETVTTEEVHGEKKKKKAILHLKSPQKVDEVPEEPEERKVRLIAHVPHDENEEPVHEKIKPTREVHGTGRFGFWKSSGRKSKTISESSDYPTTDKYEGPLDAVDRQNDLDTLPLDSNVSQVAYSPKTHVEVVKETTIKETTSTTEPEEEHRFLYIARIRHEGDEDVVDQADVKPESYGVASTSYDGPLEETAREDDLEHAPINDHASVYHPGQSWLKTAKSPTKSETVTTEEVHGEKKKKKAILHLKSPQKVDEVPEEPEERKVRLIARVPHDENEEPVHEKTKPTREAHGSGRFGFWKSSGRKSKTISESSDYPTTDKYKGPLDAVDRQNDLDTLPLDSNVSQVAYSPKTHVEVVKETTVKETTSTTEPEEEHRFLYIARVRHEGDEDVVDQADVKPESYGVASTSYDGPLEETAREDDLEHAPINDHASVYHPGQSWLRTAKSPTKSETVTTEEVHGEKKKKKAILHLKSPQKVDEVPEEPDERKVRLIARVPHDENEEPVHEKTKPTREVHGTGRFGFWKSSGRKSKTISESSDYPTTDKYEGPLDAVDRQNDLDTLPLDSNVSQVAYSPKTHVIVVKERTVKETTSTTEPGEEHRFLYIARIRHEGDEDVVDQADVKPESYGVASTSYDGPLEETAREDDLEHAPINDHASVYHPGQSWLKTAKSPTKSETVTTEEVHGEKKKKKAILHLKSPQKVDEVPEEPEERKVRLIAHVPHDENEEPVHEKIKPTREVHGTGRFGFWKSSGRKSKTISESSDYPTTDKYEGPLDAVDRQNDLDTLPLDSNVSQVAYSPKTHVIVVKERTVKETTSTTEPGEEHRFLYIARVRHEGDEDVVDQADVKPESYGVASTSYDGPLEETAREDDLEHAPINDHASVYHPGQSWLKTAKSPTKSETVTTEEVHGEKKKKKAILHLKSPQKVDEVPEEPEERKVRLIAHVPHDENEEPVHEKIKPTREVHGTGRFGFWKSSGRKSKTISESSDYPTTDKYEGPLDAVDRQNDLDTLPLDSNVSQVAYSPKTHVEVVKETTIKETTSTTEPEEEHRFLYIARVRHEGDEDVVDQADVKPESYGVASTSYDGPLEETAREDDLEHAPINDHASVYHPGQSWLKTAKSPTKSETVTTEEVHGEKKKKKKAILHLKSPQKVDEVPEEPDERKVRLIARVPHDENEEPVHEKTKPTREVHGTGRFGFWKSSGRKSKTISESSDYPTTDKYEGPLDAVDRQNDLDTLPLDSNVSQVAYSPKTHVEVVKETTIKETTSTTEPEEEHRFLYIARVRHEGDEDVVDQADVKPESYGVASTSYDGPLEETAREDDLEHAPINDHASVYHPGQSWLKTAKSPTKSETVTTEEVHGEKKKKKKAILHLKSPQKVDEVPEEPDERKVRLIARVPHDENEEPVHEKTKPTREVHGTGRFGFWKSSGRKSKTISESSDYPTTDKYEGPLDAVDRQNDLDTLPLDSNVSQVAYSPKTHVIVVKERTVKETTSTTEPGEEHRFLYIARIRHEGDEDVVDQADVKPESYGVASTSYDGPLEETAREDDLEHAPINDHASVYHPGQSWLKTAKSPTKSETVTTEEVHGEKKKKKAILHLKSPQKVDEVPEEPEERKVRLIAHVPHDENEEPVHEKIKPTREVHGTGRFGFWKSSGRKSKTISESSDYPTTDKYEGPLDAVDRQNDLDTLPLDSNVSQVAYSPKTHVEVVKETTIKETTSTTEPEEEHRFLYIARVRHEGDEDVVDQADVKPESYGVASTSYDGPLEETAREDDLEHAPINDHASVYHPGQSWLKTAKSPTKSETVTTEEVHGEKKKKKAILHLKSPQKVDEVPEEPEERKVRLIARVPHDENEEPVHEKTKPTREAHGSGRFGFWKSSGRKSKTISESSDYPTTDKYKGPLDAVDRQNDLDTLPLDSNVSQVAYSPKTHVEVVKETTVKETTSTTEPEEEHRFLYIARVRHEGDEDVVDQADVKPESYGVASTSYDGPLEETAREDDLEHAPINDHASVYHPGQSWLKTAKSPTKSETVTTEEVHGEKKKKKKAILHLKSPQKVDEVPEEPEERKVRLIARVPHNENEEPVHEKTKPTREVHGTGRFGFWKSSGRKSKTISESSDYPTTDKYEGPLDGVDRQDDLDTLPLDSNVSQVAYSPKTHVVVVKETTSTTEPEEKHRFLYIARVRHEGEEDVVDQADVKPESYGVASTSYDGPLEETAREDDLEHAPINDHASVYHPGQSWLKTAKSPTKSETVTTEEVHGEKKKKKAILHLKSPQKVDEVPEEPEERKVRLIARVPHYENEEPVHEKTKPTREVHGTGRFGFWKSSGRKSKTICESSDYPTTDKYEGPLDAVDRQNDLDTLPLDSNVSQVAYSPKTHVVVVKETTIKETTSTTEPEEEHRFLYIARVRHEGDEDVFDQADVKPESYGVASTSYDGPLEETAREDDLEHAPINDHASVYHPGQSWLKTAKSPTKSETVTREEIHGEKKKKKAILHLKSPQKVDEVPEEPEERKVRLIARVPHDENEEPVHENIKPTREVHGTGRFGFWKSSGRKSKTISESSDYPTTDKYEGPLDAVDRQNDLDTLPLDSNVSQVAYSPKTHVEVVKETTIKETTSTTEPEEEHRFLYIARIRHEGDEDVFDQADVKPESYGVASTSYDGPLEETAREDDLEHAPINDHASIYHPGQSWLKTAKSPTKSETVTREEIHGEKKKKKAILHLKSPQKVDEVPEEPEERKVRLIARVPHDENEEPVHENIKPTREVHGTGRFGFWKSSGRKSKTISESSDYPTTDKYEGPLDAVDRQNDLDTLPLDSNVSQVAYPPKTHVEVVKETTSTTEPEEEHRFLYIARVRHEGVEDVVDQADVKPESYGVASTSYDGPLEETAREDDLEHAPINDHASVYHPGQSWLKTAKSPTKSETVTTEEVHGEKKKKKAILYLKSPQKVDEVPEEPEERKVRLIARVPHDENEEPVHEKIKPTREVHGTGRFGFWKSSGRKSKTISESSDYPTTDKYEGPLDAVDRQNDLDTLPLDSNVSQVAYSPKTHVEVVKETTIKETTSTTEPEEEHRFLYIARVRHEGVEDVVDQADVKPESYGVASTSYDGPLEETAREDDLEHAPINDHASVYHPGQSWLKTAKSPTKSETVTTEEVHGEKKKKKAILHLKSPQKVDEVPEEPEERKVRLIARVPHDENEEPVHEKTKPTREVHGTGRFGFWKSSGRKSKTISESSDYPTTDKYEGPLESIDLNADLAFRPLGITSEANGTVQYREERLIASSSTSRHSFHTEGTTLDGQQWTEVRIERRVEVQLDPVYCLSGAGLGAVSEDGAGIIFTSTPPPMPSAATSFFSRFGFKTKKPKKSKGLKEADSSDSSSSEDEHHRHAVTAMAANNDNELLGKKEIEQNIADQGAASFEDQDLPQHTQSVPEVPGSPTLALEVSSEETGPQQPLTTVASWQETSIMPDDVTIDYDEHGNKITRTVKTSQVKHTVQKQTVQSYVVPDENTPGVLSVEHNRDVMTPIGTTGSGPILETHSRSLVYEGQPISSDREDLGEFVSSKTITTGNRTVETVTYKREKNGIIETHVEHRVTIHSNTDIDHDAELSAAITEATQMNPDMIVEKIEVRQESSN